MKTFQVAVLLVLAAFAYSGPIPASQNISSNTTNTDKRAIPIRDPAYDDDTVVTLINATPYRWKRGYIHQYQMRKWLKDWPEYIEPGQSMSVWIHPSEGWYDWADTAAEVEYHIEGVSKPMSLMTKFKNRYQGSTTIEFCGELSSMNNAPRSEHNIGFERLPGGTGFVLAGEEGHFISNDPPIPWMQIMLPELGERPLREIILPRSHHAGLWKSAVGIGFAQSDNTQTHYVGLYDQLANGGIRVLDFRPLRFKKTFREAHGTKILSAYHGMLGATIDEMIDIVNKFNSEYPGELIIWDINGSDAWNGNFNFRPLRREDRALLYKKFKKLHHRVKIPDDWQDISQWPLNKFIGNGQSAVLIKFDETWRDADDGESFPSKEAGFVTDKNFPVTHRWSDTDDAKWMARDQVRAFHELRPYRDRTLHIADWILTQKGIGAVFPAESIPHMARGAWRALYNELWQESTSETYPNWVAVDNVHGNQHKSILMAMNHCLVAKKCGDLGGKVKLANDIEWTKTPTRVRLPYLNDRTHGNMTTLN